MMIQILKHRMTKANPEGIDILDGEIKCIKDKLDELDQEIDGGDNEWRELKSLVGVVRDELEDNTKEVDTMLDSIVEEGDEQEGEEEGEDEEQLSDLGSATSSNELKLGSGDTELSGKTTESPDADSAKKHLDSVEALLQYAENLDSEEEGGSIHSAISVDKDLTFPKLTILK